MKTNHTASISVASYPGADKKLFDYLLDADQNVQTGSIVQIPFGPKMTLGVVRTDPSMPAVTSADRHKLVPISRMLDIPPLPRHILQLADWMMDYYVTGASAVWRTILPSGLEQKLRLKPAQQDTQAPDKEAAFTALNQAQSAAVESITSDTFRGYLLHGITGSGKTEVYIELIRRAIEQGKSALILVPEIALTPQMIERLSVHFGDKLIVSHSKLTPAKRKKIWLDALGSTQPRVYLGPRSVLFLPIKQLGIIIVDEEHEASYKQENAPTYHVNTIVAKLAELTGARYVLGSATPLIYTRRMAELGRIGYATLPERAAGAQLPSVSIVKLAHQMLSPELVNSLSSTLKAGKQAILFLNRRGSASAMLCDNCGHIEKCPRCDTSLTFHADTARLTCHYCSFRRLPPTTCPACSQAELHFIGTGTKTVEQEVQRLFGKYTIRRLDSDNATLDYIETLYQELREGHVDIVIGTQMIARGLDLPNVTMVGVILAESMLAIPDFSSNERTFELLTQVAGRAGRALSAGNVIIQTYSTTHPAIVAASHHDYDSFYTWESANRKTHAYPPYSYLVKLIYGHKDADKARQTAAQLADQLRVSHSDVVVLGPTDRAIKRVAGKHQQQIILKSLDRKLLTAIVRNLKTGWKHDLDPINLM